VHKASITVDELGAVASAVTALGVGATSAQQPPPLSVVVDRPSVFQIGDVDTGAILFVGHVVDPRAH
jgi:serpin B